MLSPAPSSETPAVQPTSRSRALARFLETHRPSLELLSGPARSLRILLDQEHLSLGRGPGVDIALDDPSLATQHAELRFTGDSFELREDLGEPMLGLAPRCTPLHAGDRFRIGNQWFEFVVQLR